MLKQRMITALILAPALIYGIIYLPMSAFMVLIGSITLLGFWEWSQFAGIATTATAPRIIWCIPAILMISGGVIFSPCESAQIDQCLTIYRPLLDVGAVWWLTSIVLACCYPHKTGLWQKNRLLTSLFGFFTLMPFLWAMVLLRAIEIPEEPLYGAYLVLLVCIVVWSADTGAYFVGKYCGRRKMAPSISPNKTIEGLLGGIITALLAGALWIHYTPLQFPRSVATVFLLSATTCASVLGDLIESMMKRNAHIKDSSRLIPGHGGVLDRIDSLTAAFPIFAWLYFLMKPLYFFN